MWPGVKSPCKSHCTVLWKQLMLIFRLDQKVFCSLFSSWSHFFFLQEQNRTVVWCKVISNIEGFFFFGHTNSRMNKYSEAEKCFYSIVSNQCQTLLLVVIWHCGVKSRHLCEVINEAAVCQAHVCNQVWVISEKLNFKKTKQPQGNMLFFSV